MYRLVFCQLPSGMTPAISWPGDLPQHRTYRSVYGASKVYRLRSQITFHKTEVFRTFQKFIGYSTCQDLAVGYAPVAFSRVRPFPCFSSFDSGADLVHPARSDPFPAFPGHHADSRSDPFVQSFEQRFGVSQFEVVHPSSDQTVQSGFSFLDRCRTHNPDI